MSSSTSGWLPRLRRLIQTSRLDQTKPKPATAAAIAGPVVTLLVFARIVDLLPIPDKWACVSSFTSVDCLPAFASAAYCSIVDKLFGSARRKKVLLLNHRHLLESHCHSCTTKQAAADETKKNFAVVARYEEFLLELLERQLPQLTNLTSLYLNIASSYLVVEEFFGLSIKHEKEASDIHYRNTGKLVDLLAQICTSNKETVTTAGLLNWLPLHPPRYFEAFDADRDYLACKLAKRCPLSNKVVLYLLGSQLTHLTTVYLPDPIKPGLTKFRPDSYEDEKRQALLRHHALRDIWRTNSLKLNLFENVKNLVFLTFGEDDGLTVEQYLKNNNTTPSSDQFPLFPNVENIYVAKMHCYYFDFIAQENYFSRADMFPAMPKHSIALTVFTLLVHHHVSDRKKSDCEPNIHEFLSRTTDKFGNAVVKAVVVHIWTVFDNNSATRWYDKSDAEVNVICNRVWRVLSSATAGSQIAKYLSDTCYKKLRVVPATLFCPFRMGNHQNRRAATKFSVRVLSYELAKLFRTNITNNNSVLRHWSSVSSTGKLANIAHEKKKQQHQSGDNADCNDGDDSFALAYCLDREKSRFSKWLELDLMG